jgi:hypothetical protein
MVRMRIAMARAAAVDNVLRPISAGVKLSERSVRVVGKPYLGITSRLPVIRPPSANTMRHILTDLAVHIRAGFPEAFL